MDSSALSAPALRAFFRVAEAWGLDDAQTHALLGNPDPSLSEQAESAVPPILDEPTLFRISYILGIYGVLRALVGDHQRMQAWLRSRNTAPVFNGRPALEVLLSGDLATLQDVRSYLDSQLAWG